MKRIVILFVAFTLGLIAKGQEPEKYHFVTDGQSVRWQCVFETVDTCRAGAFLYNLHAAGNCHDILSDIPGLISFEIAFEPAAVIEELEYNRPLMPAYITAGKYTAFVTIQLKPNRYRVTVENIHMVLPGFGDTRLEVFALKRGAWDAKFTPAPADILDYYMGSQFSNLEIIEIEKEEW